MHVRKITAPRGKNRRAETLASISLHVELSRGRTFTEPASTPLCCRGCAGPESPFDSMGACGSRIGQPAPLPGVAGNGAGHGARPSATGQEGGQAGPGEEAAGPRVYLGEILLARSLLSRATRLRQKGKPAR